MFELRVVKSHDTLLNETSTRIILKKNGKLYEADGLFFRWDSKNDKIRKVLSFEMVSEDPREFCKRIVELKKEHGLPVFSSTYETLTYWQHINGITDVAMINGMLLEDWLQQH